VTRSFSFLVDPASGGGAAPGAVVPVARVLREAGAVVDVTYSPGPRAVDALVHAAVERGDVVVAVGGDGMVSSLAGLVAAGGGTLGIVPAGRGNDLARVLALPSAPDEVARVLLEAAPRRIDLVELTLPGAAPRVVAGSVHAGVDARAAELADRARWLPRRAQYPVAALRALATYRPARVRVDVDGVVAEHDAACVVVAGSGCHGSGMRIAPGADLADGLLDVVVVEAASRTALIRSLPRVYDGTHVDLPEVTVRTGRRVELSGAGARSRTPLGGDGAPLGTLPALGSAPAVVEVRPGALAVLAP
jgi:diacylglycerol kinase family enzyme